MESAPVVAAIREFWSRVREAATGAPGARPLPLGLTGGTNARHFRLDKLADESAAVRFLDVNLRGAGQVIFQDNPLTGAALSRADRLGRGRGRRSPDRRSARSSRSSSPRSPPSCSTPTRVSLRQGLFGFNGILVGAAVPTFLAATPSMWLLLVVGAAVSTVAMLAIANVMKTWGVPALTFPFVLTTWFLMLAAYSFGTVTIDGMGPPALAHAATGRGDRRRRRRRPTPCPLLEAWLKGPAQVFLIDNWLSGILVVLGLAVSSLWAAAFALAGAAVALLVSLALGASLADISAASTASARC